MTRRAPGHMATSWRHVKCFHPPKGMHVDHLVGIEDLSAEERKAVHRHMQAADKAKPASKKPLHHLKTHPEIIAARGVKGRHAAAEQAQQHEHPGDERFQLTDDEDEDEARCHARISSFVVC